jgi:hypothetical protein
MGRRNLHLRTEMMRVTEDDFAKATGVAKMMVEQ